ncbi:MAG TPA: hypothetical protein VHB99_00970 [Pirellulales bacterium]|nr:hypothetical protein [Pirellulales bacterium]
MSTPSDPAPPAGRLQFGLRTIFGLMAWIGCVTAWATLRGAGVVVLALGLTASALNQRGVFAALQLPNPRGARFVYCGWALLIVSLFSPAVRGCGNSPVPGWSAAHAAAATQFRLPQPEDDRHWVAYAFYSTINLANLLLLLSPWALIRGRRGGGQAYAAILGASAVAVWSAAIDHPHEFLAGYYLWSLAVLCLLSAFRLGGRTLAVMLVLGMTWLAIMSRMG